MLVHKEFLLPGTGLHLTGAGTGIRSPQAEINKVKCNTMYMFIVQISVTVQLHPEYWNTLFQYHLLLGDSDCIWTACHRC